MFCPSGVIFGGTEGTGSYFYLCASGFIFGDTKGAESSFLFLLLLNSFSAVSRAPGPVFMFYIPKLIFGGTEGVGSNFYVLRFRTHVRRYQGR
jgi:hypothetical protein